MIEKRDIVMHKHNNKQKYATADMFLEFFTSFLTEMTENFSNKELLHILDKSWIKTYRALVLS